MLCLSTTASTHRLPSCGCHVPLWLLCFANCILGLISVQSNLRKPNIQRKNPSQFVFRQLCPLTGFTPWSSSCFSGPKKHAAGGKGWAWGSRGRAGQFLLVTLPPYARLSVREMLGWLVLKTYTLQVQLTKRKLPEMHLCFFTQKKVKIFKLWLAVMCPDLRKNP